METIKLIRTDKRPLAFFGEEVFNESTKEHDSTRWEVVRVFRTGNGFVVGVAYLTCWDGERDRYTAVKRKTKEEVMAAVKYRVPSLEAKAKEALYGEKGKHVESSAHGGT